MQIRRVAEMQVQVGIRICKSALLRKCTSRLRFSTAALRQHAYAPGAPNKKEFAAPLGWLAS